MLDMIRIKNKDLDCLNDNVNVFYIEKKYLYKKGRIFYKSSIEDLKYLQKNCFWNNLKELFDKMKYIAFVEVK